MGTMVVTGKSSKWCRWSHRSTSSRRTATPRKRWRWRLGIPRDGAWEETPRLRRKKRMSYRFSLKSIHWFVDFIAYWGRASFWGYFQASFGEIWPQVSDTIGYARIWPQRLWVTPFQEWSIGHPIQEFIYFFQWIGYFKIIDLLFHQFSIFSHCHRMAFLHRFPTKKMASCDSSLSVPRWPGNCRRSLVSSLGMKSLDVSW